MEDHGDKQPKNQEETSQASESTEVIQPKENNLRLFARRVFSEAKDVLKSAVVKNERVPIDEITEARVAQVINDNAYNSLREDTGEDPSSPFDTSVILANMGYLSISPDGYKAKYPEEYKRCRSGLISLVHKGILEVKLADNPNVHGEDIIYRVADEAQFQDYLKSTQAQSNN